MEQLGLFGRVDAVTPTLPGDWRVRVSRRAKRLAINVHPNGAVEIVAPPRVSARTIRRFVAEHREWIDRYASPSGRRVEHLPAAIALKAIGRRVAVRHEPNFAALELTDDTLTVGGDLTQARSALQRWLKQQAKRELAPWMARLADEIGVRFARAQFRLQRTRWGSCSSTGTVSINACVLLLEPRLCEYLLVHELCHLRHMNHSARFWRLVERHCPDGRRLDRTLGSARLELPPWIYA